jgi:hypothetical protein
VNFASGKSIFTFVYFSDGATEAAIGISHISADAVPPASILQHPMKPALQHSHAFANNCVRMPKKWLNKKIYASCVNPLYPPWPSPRHGQYHG